MKPIINIKRIYERPLKKDGYRILVDRLWPRGVTKEDAAIDEWGKALAPSGALRKWFGHDPRLWTEFQRKYKTELMKNEAAVDDFTERNGNKKVITLIYAAKDEEHTHALVLQKYLQQLYNEL